MAYFVPFECNYLVTNSKRLFYSAVQFFDAYKDIMWLKIISIFFLKSVSKWSTAGSHNNRQNPYRIRVIRIMWQVWNHKRTTLQTTPMYYPTLALNIHHGTLAAAYGTYKIVTLLRPTEPVHYCDYAMAFVKYIKKIYKNTCFFRSLLVLQQHKMLSYINVIVYFRIYTSYIHKWRCINLYQMHTLISFLYFMWIWSILLQKVEE